MSKKSEFVASPNISKNSCSFYYDNRKYFIDIDTQNKSAKLSVDGNEFYKAYNPEKGQVLKKYGEISVQIEPHCFILKRLSRRPEDYLHSLIRRFLIPIRILKTHLGLSILELFANDYLMYSSSPPKITKMYSPELINLARDKKIIQLIKEFYNQVNENYIGFTMCSK